MAKSSSSQQHFNNYLNGLQKEFKLHSNPSSASPGSSRFDIFVGGLKGEFELMALEIESLQKERDEFKAKVEELAKELQVRRNFVCEGCNESRTTPRITSSSRFKTSANAPLEKKISRPVVSSKSPHKPTHPSRGLDPSQQARPPTKSPKPIASTRVINPSLHARRPATQPMTPKPHPDSTTTPTSQHTPDPIVTSSKRDYLPSSSPPTSTTDDSESGAEDYTWSITFNDQVKKELDVEVGHLLPHDNWVMGVNFSRDGKYLAAGSSDGKAYIYSVQTGTLTCVLRNLLPDSNMITKVCFSPDGMYLATAAGDGYIYFWEIRTKHVRNAFKGHDGFIHSLDFSPNGRHLVSASDDNTVRLWNVHDGTAKYLTEDKPIFLDTPHYRSAVFSPNGKYVAASHRDGVVRIWRARTGQLMRRVKASTNWVNDIAFMPDGSGLVSGRRDSTLKYWDTSSLATTRFPSADDLHGYDSDTKEEQTWPEGGVSERGEGTCVLSVAVSPDGRWVVSAMGSRIRIWDTRNAATQCILKTSDNTDIEAVDFSPTSRHFASGDGEGVVTIWRYTDRS